MNDRKKHQATGLRSARDRLRHTLLFNGLGLAVATPAAAWVTGAGMTHTGLLGIILVVAAIAWTPLYNALFDRFDVAAGRDPAKRDAKGRLIHAIGFELGFLLPTLPLIAWWMAMTLWQALLLDLGFILFFTAYTYAFNWAYDRVFPVSKPS